eukprot:3937239-Rhodomonas_salina.3
MTILALCARALPPRFFFLAIIIGGVGWWRPNPAGTAARLTTRSGGGARGCAARMEVQKGALPFAPPPQKMEGS